MSRNLWKNLKERLSCQLEADDYRLWIEPLQPVRLDEHGLTLACPNSLHQKWIRENLLQVMQEMAQEVSGQETLKLELVKAENQAAAKRGHQQLELPRLNPFAPALNQRYIFQRFVAGKSNELACAAAKALANNKLTFSNTLFLTSGTGLGKSHLTQAVGHYVLSNSPQTRVAYLTAEDFTNEMVSALRKNQIESFKERYRRECDLLLLEEVQFLSGKEKTQDELAFTLDALLDSGKKVIFTSSEPPFEIKKLKSGLKSRLGSGITVSIDPPDHQTRVLILRAMAEEERVVVPLEVLELLAQDISGDVRRLQSALAGLLVQSSLANRAMDLGLAREVLGQISARRKRVTIEDIRDMVAKIYGLETGVLAGKSRRKNVTRPRGLAMYICRQHTDASYTSIGKIFNRDHATVMYSVDKVDREIKQNQKMAQELNHLEERLGLSA